MFQLKIFQCSLKYLNHLWLNNHLFLYKFNIVTCLSRITSYIITSCSCGECSLIAWIELATNGRITNCSYIKYARVTCHNWITSFITSFPCGECTSLNWNTLATNDWITCCSWIKYAWVTNHNIITSFRITSCSSGKFSSVAWSTLTTYGWITISYCINII